MRRSATLVTVVALSFASARASAEPHVVVLDDGERIARSAARPIGPSPWPLDAAVSLFALRGETVALQVVVEADDAPVEEIHVAVGPLADGAGRRLDARTDAFVERFIDVRQPTHNTSGGDSLAFTPRSAPVPLLLGPIADPLVPVAYETARAAPHERAAVWIDLTVPPEATASTYRATLAIKGARGDLATRELQVRVIDQVLPFAAMPAFVFYEPGELAQRMGSTAAEPGLRALLHAHHIAAVHRLAAGTLREPHVLDADRAAVDGDAYTRVRGYDGPGQAVGEGVLALGTYGTLGAPSPDARDVAEKLARGVVGDRGAGTTAAFVYAIDEKCDSDWPARWMALVRGSHALRGFRVAATCGADPTTQAADLVLQTPRDLDPARMRAAEREGKWVWAYNGMRPFAGPMMLDVPATDLRANAWIALRYGVPRWFYWESTFWFDDNRGGRGGERGFDPYVVAETFHNTDGDAANGDGILVYPGKQTVPGMVSYGVDEVFPSVRLKNLRRGVEDAGYVALARTIDAARADAIVARMVPRALAWAGERPSWPDDARAWLEARRALADIVSRPPRAGVGARGAGAPVSDGCSVVSSVRAKGSGTWFALFVCTSVVFTLRAHGARARRRPLASGGRPGLFHADSRKHRTTRRSSALDAAWASDGDRAQIVVPAAAADRAVGVSRGEERADPGVASDGAKLGDPTEGPRPRARCGDDRRRSG